MTGNCTSFAPFGIGLTAIVTFGGSTHRGELDLFGEPAARVAVTVTLAATPRITSGLASFTDSENSGLSVTATPIGRQHLPRRERQAVESAFTTSLTVTGSRDLLAVDFRLGDRPSGVCPGGHVPLARQRQERRRGATGWFGGGGGAFGTRHRPAEPRRAGHDQLDRPGEVAAGRPVDRDQRRFAGGQANRSSAKCTSKSGVASRSDR